MMVMHLHQKAVVPFHGRRGTSMYKKSKSPFHPSSWPHAAGVRPTPNATTASYTQGDLAVQRLSMTANLVIFLGILYTVLHLIGYLGLLHGYHLSGLVVALGILGLGYGIRYGSSICLYAAIGVCAGLSLYFGMLVVSAWTTYSMLRLVLGTWTLWRLCRAIPVMRILQQNRAFPLPMSRYGEAVLRRFQKRAGPKGEA
jgi:hypothetical protein